MKFPLLAAAAMLLVPISAWAAPSPVGTWEVNLAGADQGIAYVTFEEDQDFTAYGLSRDSNGLFTLSGTWSMDEMGVLTGSYTELIDGENVTGSITGKVASKKLSGRITATNGDFTIKGTPEKVTQDLAGSWTGIGLLGKTRIPELYQIAATEIPHVFTVSGSGIHPTGGEFAITGTAIAGSSGKIRIFALSQYLGAEFPGITNVAGTVNVTRTKGSLKGFESSGQAIKISLRR